MFIKEGLPEQGNLVMCTVKKILFHSVFVDLDEYNQIEGMVHISEISPGRIRNIRDYVKEGKKIVCKVLRVNQERKQIDLSLRRVNQNERIIKSTEFKQERKAEKMLESLAKDLKISPDELFKTFGKKLIENYSSLNNGFLEFASNPE